MALTWEVTMQEWIDAVSAKLTQSPSASAASDSGWPFTCRSGSAKRIASARQAMTSAVPASAPRHGRSIAITTTCSR